MPDRARGSLGRHLCPLWPGQPLPLLLRKASVGIKSRPARVYAWRLQRSRLRADFHSRVSTEVVGSFKGGWLLDVGCGPGLLEARLEARLPTARIVGLDFDRGMLTMAKSASGVRLVQGSSSHLPFRDSTMGLAVSSASLKDWGDRIAGLREIHRVLEPGAVGLVYDFITSGPGSRPPGFTRRFGVVGEMLRRAMGFVFPFTLDEVQGLARALTLDSEVEVTTDRDLATVKLRLRKATTSRKPQDD